MLWHFFLICEVQGLNNSLSLVDPNSRPECVFQVDCSLRISPVVYSRSSWAGKQRENNRCSWNHRRLQEAKSHTRLFWLVLIAASCDSNHSERGWGVNCPSSLRSWVEKCTGMKSGTDTKYWRSSSLLAINRFSLLSMLSNTIHNIAS